MPAPHPAVARATALLTRGHGGAALLFLACLLAFGLYSVRLGSDRNWDLRNYHLFAAHALLHGRMFHDLLAAQMQSFFNPLASVPVYLLMGALETRPKLYAFVMGLPAGVHAGLLLLIAHAHARAVLGEEARWAPAFAGLCGALALTGAAFLPLVGLSTGDVLVGLPLLLAYGLVLREVLARDADAAVRVRAWAVLLAGLLIGVSAGLKLTNVPYGAGLGLMVLLLLGLRAAVLAGAALGAGFLLTTAPHAWALYAETGNPIFPQYNHLFASPDLPAIAIADRRFLPRSLLQGVFYPFWWLRRTMNLVGETPMRDPRVALGYLSVLALLPMLLLARTAGLRRGLLLPIGVAMIAYAIWAVTFGIHRYLVVLEGLSAILLMLALLLGLGPGRRRLAWLAMGAILLVCLVVTVRPNWGHGPHGRNQILGLAALPVAPGTLVVTLDGEPHGYLATRLPPGARMIGLGTNLAPLLAGHGLDRRLREIIAAQQGPFLGVATPSTPPEERAAVLARFGLAPDGGCTLLRTGLDRGGHLLCPVRRAP